MTTPKYLRRIVYTPHVFLVASFFLSAGILSGRGLPKTHLDPPLLALIDGLFSYTLVAIPALAIFYYSSRARKLFFTLAFIAGVLLISNHDNYTPPADNIGNFGFDGKKSISMRITAIEKVTPTTVRYLAEVEKVDGKKASGKVRWYAYKKRVTQRYLPGDFIKVDHARLKKPRGFHNIGGWDYERFLIDRRIGSLIFTSSTTTVSLIGKFFHWRRPIEILKNRMRKNITFDDQIVTAIGRAALIGDQGYITPEMRTVFAKTGLSHLLAVSGLHVGFIALFIYGATRTILFLALYPGRYRWVSAGVPMTLAAIAALCVAVGYGLLTGPRFPAYRATIMISVYLVAVIAGRGRNFFGAFAAAFLIILIFRPWALFDVGFQLSFAAVFCISVFTERFFGYRSTQEIDSITSPSPLFQKFPSLAGLAGMSIAAFFGTAPLAAYHFNVIASYTIPLNIAVLPFVSVAMPVGILLAIFSPAMTEVVTGPMMELIGAVAVWGSYLPYAARYIPATTMSAAILLYFLAAIFVVTDRGIIRRIAIGVTSAALLIALMAPYVAAKMDDRLVVRFLDIGQGDAIVIHWPEGAIVVDGGNRYKTFDPGASIVAPVLWRAQKTTLSAMFATHGDNDHAGGLLGIAKIIPPDKIFDNGQQTRKPMRYLAQLRSYALRRGIWSPIYQGERLEFDGGVTLDVLNPHPGDAKQYTTVNSRSMVLKLTYGDVKVLLMADAGAGPERWMIESGADIKADVIKIGHHGGADATTARFLKATGAKTAVITVGYKNRFRHPAKSTLEKLKNANIEIYRTDIDGEIVMRTDGKTIEWETYEVSETYELAR